MIGEWQFDSEHIDGQTVKAMAGTLDGTITGSAVVDEYGELEALPLDGASVSVNVTDDITKANLPQKTITAEAWVRLDASLVWGGLIGAFQDNGWHGLAPYRGLGETQSCRTLEVRPS